MRECGQKMGHSRPDFTYRYDQRCYLVHYRSYRGNRRQTADERRVLCDRTESSRISGLYGNRRRHPGRSGSRTDGDDHCYGKMEECVCTVTSGRCHSCNSFCLDHCRTTSFCAACKVYLPDFERCGGCSHYFYCFDCQKRKKVSKKLKKIEKSVRIRLQRKDRHAIM